MTEGAAEPIEQAVAPSNSREKASLWSSLRAFWWVRGIFGALALLGVLDTLGWVRDDWLRVVHALGARWNDWMGWLVGWVNLGLPEPLEITQIEANFLVAFATLAVPALTSDALWAWKSGSLKDVLHNLFVAVLPLLMCVIADATSDSPFGPVGAVFFFLVMFVGGIMVLWARARTYLKALTTAMLFFLTLEAVYLAPAAQKLLQPVVDWIDPAGATPPP